MAHEKLIGGHRVGGKPIRYFAFPVVLLGTFFGANETLGWSASCHGRENCEMIGDWAVSYIGELQAVGFRQFWKSWYQESYQDGSWQSIIANCDDGPDPKMVYRPLIYKFSLNIAVSDHRVQGVVRGHARMQIAGDEWKHVSVKFYGNVIIFEDAASVAQLLKIEKPFALYVDYPTGVRSYQAPFGVRQAIDQTQAACGVPIS
jgi:uncharacterized protein YjlB